MRHVQNWWIGILVLAVWGASPTVAQPFHAAPSYFAVDGVSSDDVLNVRRAPNAAAEIVGSLTYNAWPVEVVVVEGTWAYVSSGEGMGWVSTAYLREIDVPAFFGSALPDGLVCSGTEPFWGLTASGAGISFAGMDMDETLFEATHVDGFAGVGPSKSFIVAEGSGQSLAAVVSDEICSDGMSDRDYPRRIDMILFQAGGPVGYTGCCSLPVN